MEPYYTTKMEQNNEKQKQSENRKKNRTKKTLLIVLGVILLVLGVAAFFGIRYVNRILKQPEKLFVFEAETPLPEKTPLAPAFPITTPKPDEAQSAAETPAPTKEATQETEPTAEPTASPESNENKGILNILLMGIDAFENGGTTSGTMPHTDTIMVIAVNFDQDTVDLITLPRDTLTTVPGYHGFYKLNGVFNVGLGGKFQTTGKADDLADGFKLTCRAAEQWLGGISIPYYYGVDFQAVIDIVDAIGGIDYDVDQPFRSMDRLHAYGLGMHHLDGTAVLSYLRIRHAADGLDSSRTARQRRMMVAIFRKLKNEGKLSQIPALISAANSGIYTNTSIGQTVALVNYASNLDPDRIRTRAMFGNIGAIERYWRFAYVDQQNRIDIIREVYGIEAKPVGICTRQYERWLVRIGFSAIKHLHQVEKVLKVIQEKKDAGETFTEEQIALYSDCYSDYIALQNAFDADSSALQEIYLANPWREKRDDQKYWTKENEQMDQELKKQEKEIFERLTELSEKLENSTNKLAKTIDYRKCFWYVWEKWYEDPDINEVYVDFN